MLLYVIIPSQMFLKFEIKPNKGDFMTVAVCISDGGGMMFNKRRQSRDKTVIHDVLLCAGERKVIVSQYSASLFLEYESDILSVANPLSEAKAGSFVFVEDDSLLEYKKKIKEIYIYKWNRKYPFDLKLDFHPETEGMHLDETVEFVGNSHEKITRELWKY